MKCPKCDFENERRAFCKNCGIDLYQEYKEENFKYDLNKVNQIETDKKSSTYVVYSLVYGVSFLLLFIFYLFIFINKFSILMFGFSIFLSPFLTFAFLIQAIKAYNVSFGMVPLFAIFINIINLFLPYVTLFWLFSGISNY